MAKVKIDSPEKDRNIPDNEQGTPDAETKEEVKETKEAAAEAPAKEAEEAVAEEAAREKTEANEDAEKKNQSFFNKKRQKETSKHEKELESEVAKLKAEISDEKNRYLRLLADFDNFKKRTAKESDAKYLDSKADTLKKFLTVIDAYERALKVEVPEESKQYTAGFEMIYDIFKKILEENGVEEIKALGESFDPSLHNAVMHVEDESAGQNVIVEVFEKGYRMGDRILRYSIVKVAN